LISWWMAVSSWQEKVCRWFVISLDGSFFMTRDSSSSIWYPDGWKFLHYKRQFIVDLLCRWMAVSSWQETVHRQFDMPMDGSFLMTRDSSSLIWYPDEWKFLQDKRQFVINLFQWMTLSSLQETVRRWFLIRMDGSFFMTRDSSSLICYCRWMAVSSR
jgi:hypothetical protein